MEDIRNQLYKNITARQALELLRPAVLELAAAHARGEIYGNISPASIVVTDHIRFCFPLSEEAARTYNTDRKVFIRLLPPEETQKERAGTDSPGSGAGRRDAYIPLEQLLGDGLTGPRSDVYSLCAVLYQRLTGIDPPDARSRISGAEPVKPSALGIEISTAREAALLRGLAVMEKDRYADGGELYQALYGTEDGESELDSESESDSEAKGDGRTEANGEAETDVETQTVSGADSVSQEKHEAGRAEGEKRLTEMLKSRLRTLEEAERKPGEGNDRIKTPARREDAGKPVRAAIPSDHTVPENVLSRVWRSRIRGAKKIRRITFLDTVPGQGTPVWDVSEKRDGSVAAWAEKKGSMLDRYYYLYIGGAGGVKAPEDGTFLFSLLKELEEIVFQGNFYTAETKSANSMFFNCTSLWEADTECFDTSQMTDMNGMFWGCQKLRHLDVSGFDTSRVTDMRKMFCDCQNLVSLDASGFDTAQVTNMSSMFCDCRNLVSLDVSGFNTARVTDMSSMFSGCQELGKLDVSGFDTAAAKKLNHMFYGCKNLKRLDVSGFDTAQVDNMEYMFWGCTGLESLDISHFDLSHGKHTGIRLPSHLQKNLFLF